MISGSRVLKCVAMDVNSKLSINENVCVIAAVNEVDWITTLSLSLCVFVCFPGMQTNKPKEKTIFHSGSTTVFPSVIKGIHKYTQTQISSSVSSIIHSFSFSLSFLTTHNFTSLPPSFRFPRTGSPGNSSHYRHVDHFHHGHRHCSHHHVLHPEGQTEWPGWDE